MSYTVCGANPVTCLQNFAKGLTDGCFMEGFMRMKRVPGRYALTAHGDDVSAPLAVSL
jgi:hypothetical protein